MTLAAEVYRDGAWSVLRPGTWVYSSSIVEGARLLFPSGAEIAGPWRVVDDRGRILACLPIEHPLNNSTEPDLSQRDLPAGGNPHKD